MKKTWLQILFALALSIMTSSAAVSSLVYDDQNGVLQYGTYANQGQSNSVNTVPDYSRCGYQGGGVPIPFIPAAVTIDSPTGEDDRALLQDAIDQLEAMPLQSNGFRGAVLIKAGNYRVSSGLTIQASGVVIRGEGSQLEGGTRITMTATVQDNLFEVSGGGAPVAVAGTTQRISDAYVPVGTQSFNVVSAAEYAVGDSIRVQNMVNDQWIEDLGMDDLSATDPDDTDWTAGAYQLFHERTVTGIDGNTLTLDAPIVQAIEDQYGGGQVFKYTFDGQIENVGFEALRLDSTYVSNHDEDHGWIGVRFVDTRNGWMRQVTGQYFGYGLVSINDRCHFFTVEDCAMLDHKSITTGGRKYSFNLDDCSYVLVQRCYTRGGRHDYVSGSKTPGPNTFVDARADNTFADVGPHHRYATGQLYDNIKCGQLNVWNRKNMGSGHGWAGAQVMFWNCDASSVRCDVPTGAMNWAIGCDGTKLTSGEPEGIFESHGTHVTPRSLYYRQLRERLGMEPLLGVILPQQAAGTVWSELKAWGGEGLFLDELVVWYDVVLGTADLRGIVRNLQMLDKGINATWSKVSGPGSVTFTDEAALETTASFSVPGQYVLRLLVDDGSDPIVKEVIVSVDSALSPVAHWKLDEGSGSTAADHSGNGYDGTISGGTWVAGQDGGALDFNRAAGDKITLPAAVFGTVTNEVSVAFWAHGDETVLPETSFALRAVDAAGNRVFSIALPSSDQQIHWLAGNSSSSSFDRISKVAVASEYAGQWNHWVFTKNAVSGVMEIYLNGVLWHSGSGLTRSMAGIASATISGDGTTSSYDGAFDDFRVYDTALSGTEVSTLYHTYLPGPPAFANDPMVGANALEETDYRGTIADEASDPDYDPMIFTKHSGPDWLIVASDGTLSGMPAPGDVGLNSFTVEVTDGVSGTNSATLEITVEPGYWTVYTVTGFDNDAGTITTDHGVLNKESTFGDRDELVVDEAALNGFTFDGWNLSNLTIKAGAGSDDHFKGITFAANTVDDGLTMDSNYSFRYSPEAVFSGGVSGVTFTGRFAFRYANEMLSETDWSGAIIHAEEGSGYDIGSIDWEAVDVDWSGATIYAGFRFLRDGNNYDHISWEGVTFNITAAQIWRHYNSSADDLGAKRGVMGRNWNNSTINATGGGLFDSYNKNGFSGTYTFDGADVNGDLFKDTSNNEIYQPTVVDFSGADVSDLKARSISGLANLTVVYDPETTIFGTYTEVQALADGWVKGTQLTYNSWAVEYSGLTNFTPDFDQDFDGLNNLLEYALGGDPTVDDVAALLPQVMVDENNMYYVYRRQNPKDLDLKYDVLSGDDLVAGLTNATPEVGVSPAVDGFETATNALPITTPAGFMQLKIARTVE